MQGEGWCTEGKGWEGREGSLSSGWKKGKAGKMRVRGKQGNERRTAMLNNPGVSWRSVKFSSAKERVP